MPSRDDNLIGYLIIKGILDVLREPFVSRSIADFHERLTDNVKWLAEYRATRDS